MDGSGSYDDVVKNIPLWQKQFPNSSTKVTFASADLKYLKESIIHLWNLGLKLIPANVVFEDVWQEGDDLIFEEQLKKNWRTISLNIRCGRILCQIFSIRSSGSRLTQR